MFRITCTYTLLAVATLAGCATTGRQTSQSTIPPLYVPSAMTIQSTDPSTGQLALNPNQILPSSDAFAYFTPRPDKFAYGQTIYAQSTEYSIFTYDQQLISNLWGPSYRYRWVVQSGLTSP